LKKDEEDEEEWILNRKKDFGAEKGFYERKLAGMSRNDGVW
jgi:hypothetical protein